MVGTRIDSGHITAGWYKGRFSLEALDSDPRVVNGAVFAVDGSPLTPDIFLVVADSRVENRKPVPGTFAMDYQHLLQVESCRPIPDQVRSAHKVHRVHLGNHPKTLFQASNRVVFQNKHVTPAAAILKKTSHRVGKP